MGFIQKDAFRTMLINYIGIVIGYLNKGFLFLVIFSAEQYGLINLILSVGMLFATFSNLGTINAVIRFLPFFKEHEERRQNFLILNLAIVLAGVLIFSALFVLLHDEITWLYQAKSPLFVSNYFWVIPIGIANIFFLVFQNYLHAIYKNILSVFMYELVLRLCITVLLILCATDLINFKQFLIWHAVVYFVPSIVLLIYLFKINELKFKKSTYKISRRFKRIIFSFSFYSYLNTIGALVVTTMDALMISYYLGLAETGVYTTIMYFLSAFQIPYRSLVRICVPLIPKYWREKNMAEMKKLYIQVSNVSLYIGILGFMVVWCNRDFLFSLLPDDFHFDTVSLTFLFLMAGRMIDMYFGLNGYILVSSKKYKIDILFTFTLIISVFFLNMWLVPLMGIPGAALAFCLVYFAYNLIRLVYVHVVYKLHPFTWNQFKLIALFLILTGLFEILRVYFPSTLLFSFINCVIILFTFIIPVHYLKWIPEITNYTNDGLKFVTTKIFRS